MLSGLASCWIDASMLASAPLKEGLCSIVEKKQRNMSVL
jgi:hypothetical protein